MLHLLAKFDLEPARRSAVGKAIARKCAILSNGFARRGNFQSAALAEKIGYAVRQSDDDRARPDFAAMLEKARMTLLGSTSNSIDADRSVGASA